MPDLNPRNVRLGDVSQSATPSVIIEAIVRDRNDAGQDVILHDFTGANVIRLPADIARLSPDDQLALGEMVANFMIYRLSGLPV